MRILLALCVALAVALGLAGLWAHGESLRADIAADKAQTQKDRADGLAKGLDRANAQADLLRKTSLARQQELNRIRAERDATQKALNEALKANPDWAGAPVPSGVYDALTSPAPVPASKAGPGLDGNRPGAKAPG